MKVRADLSLKMLAILMAVALVIFALIGAVISAVFHVSYEQALVDIGLCIIVCAIIDLAMVTLEPHK